jgi:starch synthase
VTIGYNEALAHQLFGAGDVTLVPSLFEPCGLTQMYGLKYGSLPLVRRVGGLADTVVDSTLEDMASGEATGFVFDGFDVADYDAPLRRAFALYQRAPDWRRVRGARHAPAPPTGSRRRGPVHRRLPAGARRPSLTSCCK